MKNAWVGTKPVFVLLAALMMAGLCGCGGGDSGTGSSSQSPSPPPGSGIPGIESIRQEFLDSVNQARSAGRMCGTTPYPAAPPVGWNDTLALAAYLHSEDMATNQFVSHAGSDGSSPGDRLIRERYAWRTYGENIAVFAAVALFVGVKRYRRTLD